MKRIVRTAYTLLLMSVFAAASFANVSGAADVERYDGSRHRISRHSKRVRVSRGSIYARRVRVVRVRHLNRSQIREVYRKLIDIKVD